MNSGIRIKDYSTGEQPIPEEQSWDTTQLGEDFDVVGFSAPFVVVIRKSDGKRGSLQFSHSPRKYWGWSEG